MSEERITVINPFAKMGLSNANAASKKKNRCDVCVGTGIIRYEIIGDKRIECSVLTASVPVYDT